MKETARRQTAEDHKRQSVLVDSCGKPARLSRLAFALLAAGYGVALVLWDVARDPSAGGDFDQLWYAATALRHGLNPYQVIGPTGPWHAVPWPLYYPMPAIIIAWPFSFFPVVVARCVFTGLSSALLAYGVTATNYLGLLVFVSGAYLESARVGQWSILFAASCLLPWLAATFPAKPTLGLICAPLAFSRRWLVPVVAVWTGLLAVSWLALPEWFASWRQAISAAPHILPLIAAPGGELLLLAVLRWRRPEAIMLLMYAVVPHTRVPYEAVPVMLVAKTRVEWLVLCLGSTIAYGVQALNPWYVNDRFTRIAGLVVACIYFPAIVIVLRRPSVSA